MNSRSNGSGPGSSLALEGFGGAVAPSTRAAPPITDARPTIPATSNARRPGSRACHSLDLCCLDGIPACSTVASAETRRAVAETRSADTPSSSCPRQACSRERPGDHGPRDRRCGLRGVVGSVRSRERPVRKPIVARARRVVADEAFDADRSHRAASVRREEGVPGVLRRGRRDQPPEERSALLRRAACRHSEPRAFDLDGDDDRAVAGQRRSCGSRTLAPAASSRRVRRTGPAVRVRRRGRRARSGSTRSRAPGGTWRSRRPGAPARPWRRPLRRPRACP